MQTFAEHEIHSIPRHQHSKKTDYAGDYQAEFAPPAGESSVQGEDGRTLAASFTIREAIVVREQLGFRLN